MADLSSVVNEAVDAWYTASYPFGVRLRIQERKSLAAYVVQRVATHPNLSQITSARSEQSDDSERPTNPNP